MALVCFFGKDHRGYVQWFLLPLQVQVCFYLFLLVFRQLGVRLVLLQLALLIVLQLGVRLVILQLGFLLVLQLVPVVLQQGCLQQLVDRLRPEFLAVVQLAALCSLDFSHLQQRLQSTVLATGNKRKEIYPCRQMKSYY